MTDALEQKAENRETESGSSRRRPMKERLQLAFLGAVIVFGGLSGGCQVGTWIKERCVGDRPFFKPKPQSRYFSDIPKSKNPGPPRSSTISFTLDASNSVEMEGMNDPKRERWADLADNYYTRKFAVNYDYTKIPTVRVKVEPQGTSLKGRLEAWGLKPNFAYQIKLMGDFKDRKAYENIGSIGRWRLPGDGTNYTDDDYRSYPDADKHTVEAYVLFDYFVTDEEGSAQRDFELDSSLHVLWRDDQNTWGVKEGTVTEYVIDASDSQVYSTPVYEDKKVGLWAERERDRYQSADQIIRLPKGDYKAFLVLTEESLHSFDFDGGFWATVMTMQISFSITE